MQRLRLINRIVFYLNIAAVWALVMAYLASRNSPADYWFFAFFGLGYPVILVFNFLFFTYWLIQLRWQALLSLTAMVIGLRTMDNFYHVPLFTKPLKATEAQLAQNPEETYKIMSYNVRLFDLYNWTNNTTTRDQIFKLLADEAPDIICFQEFYYEDDGQFNSLDTMQSFLKAKNIYLESTTTVQKKNHFGIATFSKFPILNTGKIVFGKTADNLVIYTDLAIGKDTVRVYNAHLQSIRLQQEDYRVLKDIMQGPQIDELGGAKNIMERLKKAFVRRAWQAEVLAAHAENCPYRAIICGDFNDSPTSYTYATLTRNFYDAFKQSSSGLGRTHIGTSAALRIDYILHSPGIKTAGFETIARELSDHYPIVCDFQVSEP